MADIKRRVTAATAVSRVLRSLGLPVPNNISGAQDATSRQMWALLTECGQDLLTEYDWQDLIRTHTINTTVSTTYGLPDDFERYIDETGWNNTSRIPLLGPMTRQQWRLLQARQLGGTTLRVQYIIENGQIKLYFAPTPSQTLQMDYISRGWVTTAAGVPRDAVESDDDTIIYNPRLIISCLKYKWREAKGFDTTASYNEYKDVLAASKYSDSPKRTLNLSGTGQYPHIGIQNLPDTQYGS